MLPILATLWAEEEWVLGAPICSAVAVYKYSFILANIFLVLFLSLHCLLRCMGSRGLVTRRSRVMVTMVTVGCSCVPCVFDSYTVFIGGVKEVFYLPAHCLCGAEFVEGAGEAFLLYEQVGSSDSFSLLLLLILDP